MSYIKKIGLCLLFLLVKMNITAQTTLPPFDWFYTPNELITDGQNDQINTEFATKINLAFQLLEKSRVPNGLLKDQAFEFTELATYS